MGKEGATELVMFIVLPESVLVLTEVHVIRLVEF